MIALKICGCLLFSLGMLVSGWQISNSSTRCELMASADPSIAIAFCSANGVQGGSLGLPCQLVDTFLWIFECWCWVLVDFGGYAPVYPVTDPSGNWDRGYVRCVVTLHVLCHCTACAAMPCGMYFTAQLHRALLVLGSAVLLVITQFDSLVSLY